VYWFGICCEYGYRKGVRSKSKIKRKKIEQPKDDDDNDFLMGGNNGTSSQ